ncbi:hypothetical protein [Evansella cellulosilytica]|uniref:hypothetical protein n=1 Tax=Evansella cellulosilytica TaxID=1413 RepID=UPI00030E1C14|nr:hypothetical protein [Evansella cellulosilytica]
MLEVISGLLLIKGGGPGALPDLEEGTTGMKVRWEACKHSRENSTTTCKNVIDFGILLGSSKYM